MRSLLLTSNFPHVVDQDKGRDDSGQQVDDGHDGAEHDQVGAGHARPEHTDGHNLHNEAERVDQQPHRQRLRQVGLGEAPQQAGHKHQVDEEISLGDSHTVTQSAPGNGGGSHRDGPGEESAGHTEKVQSKHRLVLLTLELSHADRREDR